MNRPRHFDLDSLRECVTDVFTEHGYRGTSMSMLADASGLGKQSLYNAIGDKEAAYLQSLECASARNAGLQALMLDAANGRQALQDFFAKVVEFATSPEPARHTCIFTAGLMEGIDSDAVAAKLQEKWHELCMLMESTVERGQQDGSIRADVPSVALREVLTTLFLGIRVASRTHTERQALTTTVHWVMKLLDKGAPTP